VAAIVTPLNPHEVFAPPQPIVAPTPSPKKKRAVEEAKQAATGQCSRCRGNLPAGRGVNFCPECGFDLRRSYCPQCNAELEPQWRHCVSCGLPLSRG
jgi:predicted amidophosphoribosyltransferase